CRPLRRRSRCCRKWRHPTPRRSRATTASCDLSVGCSSGVIPEHWRCEPSSTPGAPDEPAYRLTPRGRALLVERVIDHGLRVEEAAHAAGVSVRTAYKWLRRFREEGLAGLQDRSSRPHRSPSATPPAVVEQVVVLRRQRQTYRQISRALPVGLSTIARLMRRAGLHRLAELEPARSDNRYEYPAA